MILNMVRYGNADAPNHLANAVPKEGQPPCSEALQEKFAKWHKLMVQDQIRFNDNLEKQHSFRNPSIMSKLIEFIGVDEHGTHFVSTDCQQNYRVTPVFKDPFRVSDDGSFEQDAYYDRIAAMQIERARQVNAVSHPSLQHTRPISFTKPYYPN